MQEAMEKKTVPEVVVITGASAGVGRATARRFARDGASIGLVARGHDGLEAVRSEVEALGGRAVVVSADVADSDQMERAAATIEQTLGPIDIWINNAMATINAPILEIHPDEFTRATEVTYFGAVWGTMAALRRMRERNRGTIIQVSSGLAFRAIPLQAPYCGAKHALRGFTEALCCELLHEHSRIHVGMVHLPAVNTPQFNWSRTRLTRHPKPVPPVFQPEVAADAIHWAAHHRRRDLYVGASSLAAKWASFFAPRLADRYLAQAGYTQQQTEQEIDPNTRADNLWSPVSGDAGAHGIFDQEACARSPQLWATQHRGWIAAGVLGAAAVGGWLLNRRRRNGG